MASDIIERWKASAW